MSSNHTSTVDLTPYNIFRPIILLSFSILQHKRRSTGQVFRESHGWWRQRPPHVFCTWCTARPLKARSLRRAHQGPRAGTPSRCTSIRSGVSVLRPAYVKHALASFLHARVFPICAECAVHQLFSSNFYRDVAFHPLPVLVLSAITGLT